MDVTDKGLVVGAAVTLTQLGKKLRELVQELPGTTTTLPNVMINTLCVSVHQVKVFSAILAMLRWFAGQQIRNVVVSLAT